MKLESVLERMQNRIGENAKEEEVKIPMKDAVMIMFVLDKVIPLYKRIVDQESKEE